MKKTKECSENNPRFKMMEGGITLQEIEKWYGKDTANALVKYCDENGLEIDEVAADDKKWDLFERWTRKQGAKKDRKGNKIGMGTDSKKFSNWTTAAGLDDLERKRKYYKMKTRSRYGKEYPFDDDNRRFTEGSGSHMDEQDILDFIGEELRGCEWV